MGLPLWVCQGCLWSATYLACIICRILRSKALAMAVESFREVVSLKFLKCLALSSLPFLMRLLSEALSRGAAYSSCSHSAKHQIMRLGTITPDSKYLGRKKLLPLTKRALRNTLMPLLRVVPAVKKKIIHVCQIFSCRPFCIALPHTYRHVTSMNIERAKWSGTIKVSIT